MSALVDPESDIARQARRWAVVQADAPLPAPVQKRFEHWLAADPAHAIAFEASRALLQDLAGLENLRAYAKLPERPPSSLERLRLWAVGALGGSRVGWALGAVIACLALAAVMIWPLVRVTTDSYATGVGQTRQLALADGSRIDLGPSSSLRVQFSHGRRLAFLDRGEAFFSVAKQHGRSFFVDAGQAQVRVVGTRFNVRRDDRSVHVAVQEGVVQVGAKAGRVTLRGGQGVVAHDGALAEGRVDAALAGAWREGRVYYDGATLAEVVADARRYSTRRIAFASPQAAGVRITASFRVQGYETFITDLPAVAPVEVTTSPDDALLIATAAKTAG